MCRSPTEDARIAACWHQFAGLLASHCHRCFAAPHQRAALPALYSPCTLPSPAANADVAVFGAAENAATSRRQVLADYAAWADTMIGRWRTAEDGHKSPNVRGRAPLWPYGHWPAGPCERPAGTPAGCCATAACLPTLAAWMAAALVLTRWCRTAGKPPHRLSHATQGGSKGTPPATSTRLVHLLRVCPLRQPLFPRTSLRSAAHLPTRGTPPAPCRCAPW